MPDRYMIYYTPKELVLRSSGDPAALAPVIRQIVSRADPDVPLARVRTLSDVVSTLTAPRATQVVVLQAFAALSLLLAGIGIHGLLAYAVSQRKAEIGLRLALGAGSGNILQMVLSRAFALAGVGSLLGIVLAYLAGRQMAGLLAGIAPSDPLTFAMATALVVTMTLAGSLIPALRALRVEAVSVMRAE
jgi:ABC-type antimicrobial peptide transport system permease subunit